MKFIFLIISIIVGFLLFAQSTDAEAPTEVVLPLPEKTPCEQYKDIIRTYDWDHEIAIAIMLAESGCRTDVVNDNQATGDYSIGLFQINLYGANAKHRPSEEALKDPETNIEFAYNLYKSSGFRSQWGVCRHSVKCYN